MTGHRNGSRRTRGNESARRGQPTWCRNFAAVADESGKEENTQRRPELDLRIHEDQLNLDEQRLKLDQEDREARRHLDEQRLKLEQEGQDQRNIIDVERATREGKLFRANSAAIITAIVTLFVSGVT